jgi:molybdenum cofactor biosynthesis enzyme MoaA
MGKGLSFEELMQLAELKKKEDEAAERIRAARIAANKEQEAEREREMKSRRGQASKVYAQNAKQKIGIAPTSF